MLNLKEFIPKSITCLLEGYTKETFFKDLFAGLTVGIIALPLSMAFALGSGVSPERGLFTAIVAGFLISLLGGSRVQIGGPTGAFVVIVYGVVERFGYEGLVVATFMAGVMLVLMGLARFGFFLRFIPYPVTTGFTSGIALVIFSSQMKDFFGLEMGNIPSEFLQKWSSYLEHMHDWNPWALCISSITLGTIFVLRHFYPKLPGSVLAVAFATGLVWFFELPVETIEKKFGVIPDVLPSPKLPSFSLEQIRMLLPDAIAIALLGAIESLLSAVVADGMIGQRHRSNCELVAQGFANMVSVVFGGIPATGAIARTGANIKMGAQTPMAGVVHALTLFLILFMFAPAASKIPLPALAGILVFVAWNMSEIEHFVAILKGPFSDVCVLLMSFFLTVLIDLTVAVQVGVLLAAVLFLKRMTDSTTIKIFKAIIREENSPIEITEDADILKRKDIPDDVTVFEINGPFFFGVSDLLNEGLELLGENPRAFILRLHKVPLVDITGIRALKLFHDKCLRLGVEFYICEASPSVFRHLDRAGLIEALGQGCVFNTLHEALSTKC